MGRYNEEAAKELTQALSCNIVSDLPGASLAQSRSLWQTSYGTLLRELPPPHIYRSSGGSGAWLLSKCTSSHSYRFFQPHRKPYRKTKNHIVVQQHTKCLLRPCLRYPQARIIDQTQGWDCSGKVIGAKYAENHLQGQDFVRFMQLLRKPFMVTSYFQIRKYLVEFSI